MREPGDSVSKSTFPGGPMGQKPRRLHRHLFEGQEGGGSGGMFDFGACKEDGPETWDILNAP